MDRPYLIDLESSNGTKLNGETIEAARYYELKSGDVVAFGFSKREFVLVGEDEAGDKRRKKKSKSKKSRRRHSSSDED
jgi:pSer/pThr/pTyr-binding forkhead associated (FHA) protein